MLRAVAVAVGAVVGGLAVIALAVAVPAHWQIRHTRPPLPGVEAIERAGLELPPDAPPVAVHTLHTARQAMPRSAVLSPTFDPTPDRPYHMTHPAFAVEWPDGRLFLIDLGMRRETALAFGAPIERLSGAEPIQPLADVAEALGPAVARVAGVGFTHLHGDHVDGLAALCGARAPGAPPLAIVQGPAQAELHNYTTRGGHEQVTAARCGRPQRLPAGSLVPVPDFPGLWAIETAGHTPGHQWWLARVGRGDAQRLWLWLGDVSNHIDGVLDNIPKPALYSWAIVPEAPERLERLRTLAAALQERGRVQVLVSHDDAHLRADGPPAWRERATVDR